MYTSIQRKEGGLRGVFVFFLYKFWITRKFLRKEENKKEKGLKL